MVAWLIMAALIPHGAPSERARHLNEVTQPITRDTKAKRSSVIQSVGHGRARACLRARMRVHVSAEPSSRASEQPCWLFPPLAKASPPPPPAGILLKGLRSESSPGSPTSVFSDLCSGSRAPRWSPLSPCPSAPRLLPVSACGRKGRSVPAGCKHGTNRFLSL